MGLRINAGGIYFKLGPVDPAIIWTRRLFGIRHLIRKIPYVQWNICVGCGKDWVKYTMVLRLFCFRTISSKNNNFTMWFQCVPLSFCGIYIKKEYLQDSTCPQTTERPIFTSPTWFLLTLGDWASGDVNIAQHMPFHVYFKIWLT